MAEKDQGAKAVIQLRPEDYIKQALPDAEYLGPLPTDVATEPQLLLDTLYRIRYHNIECAINIEVQAALDKQMPACLFQYGSRAIGVHGLSVISVVFWLHKTGVVPASPYQLWVDDRPIVSWHYINIEMRKLSASDMLNTRPLGLLPFIPFMKGANEQAAEQAMQRLKAQAPEEQTDTLAFSLAVFIAKVFKSEDLALAIVRRVFMSTDIFKDSPLYQTLVREAREEERVKALRESAQLALTGRFGPLSNEMRQALNVADEPTLLAIIAHVSSDSLEQVRERLHLPS